MNNIERLPTPHHNVQPPSGEPEPIYQDIPPHLLAEITKLANTHDEVERFAHQADGMFGPIGLDSIMTIVPGLGGLYSAYGGFKLLSCASRARCGMRTRLLGFFLTVIDVFVGAFIGVGDLIDAFLRSHRMYASMIQDAIRAKLIAYQSVRDLRNERGYLTAEDLTFLEDTLLRGGRSAGAVNIRKAVLIGLVLLVLYAVFA